LDVNYRHPLCLNKDSLFDNDFWFFAGKGSIIIAKELLIDERLYMGLYSKMQIDLEEGIQKYIKYHRNNI